LRDISRCFPPYGGNWLGGAELKGLPFLAEACSASRWRAFRETKAYDFLAAMPVIAWNSLSIANMVPDLVREAAQLQSSPLDLHHGVLILAHTAAIVFIALALIFLAVRQPPKAKAKGLVPRISAIAGSYLMVAVVWLPPQPIGLMLSFVSIALILGGVCFSIFSLSHLGRSFSLMPEARRLVTDGPYAVVRHPLYLGEAVSTLGLTLQYLSPLAFTILALQLAFQFQRMKNEEKVLGSLFPEYESYRTHTARLVPGIY
jgi:protein-S-isoprenylcysteine O-methyltransferase Ste14